MKTPKREVRTGWEPDFDPYDGPNRAARDHARWKRKNRVKQLKRIIRSQRELIEALLGPTLEEEVRKEKREFLDRILLGVALPRENDEGIEQNF